MTPGEAKQTARNIVDEACLGETFAANGVSAALAEAIAAALLKAAGQWHEIDGDNPAPRDGTEILLKTTSFDGDPLIISGWWFSSPKQIDDGWETPFGSHGEPTHWRPLPTLPVTESSAKNAPVPAAHEAPPSAKP